MSNDRTLTRVSKPSIKQQQQDEDDEEEMPFAMASASNDDSSVMSTDIFPRVGSSTNLKKSGRATTISKAHIQTHFHEALSCYIKALSMLKSSISASQRVLQELKSLSVNNASSPPSPPINQFKQRCDVSHTWLAGQFKGVLERAD